MLLMQNSDDNADGRMSRRSGTDIIFVVVSTLHCVPKMLPDIIDCKLKEDDQIVIFLVRILVTQLAIKRPFKFAHHPAKLLIFGLPLSSYNR